MKRKRCYRCKRELLLNNFYRNKHTTSGFSNECKKCNIKRIKEYREKNKKNFEERKSLGVLSVSNKTTKICSGCKKELSLDLFCQNSCTKDGLSYYCWACRKISADKYLKKNRKILLRKQRKRSKTAESRATRQKYIETNKERIRKYHVEWYKKNRDSVLAHQKVYEGKNKDKPMKRYYKRMAEEPEYRITFALRARLTNAVREQNTSKRGRTFELVGCSASELKKYLELLFLPGMSWDNYGKGENKWCMDHIIPCVYFDLTKLEEQKKCFHYTNIRPLWWIDNVAKNSKYQGKTVRAKDHRK